MEDHETESKEHFDYMRKLSVRRGYYEDIEQARSKIGVLSFREIDVILNVLARTRDLLKIHPDNQGKFYNLNPDLTIHREDLK